MIAVLQNFDVVWFAVIESKQMDFPSNFDYKRKITSRGASFTGRKCSSYLTLILTIIHLRLQVHPTEANELTHRGWVMHICISKLTVIASDNGLSPGQCQAIVWTNAGKLLIGPLGTNLSEI